MARTRHALPTHIYHIQKVQNRRKAEQAALDEIKEYEVPFRHTNRLQNFWSIIPEPYDDKPNAAANEYHNKQYWVTKRAKANQPHYRRHSIVDAIFREVFSLYDDEVMI